MRIRISILLIVFLQFQMLIWSQDPGPAIQYSVHDEYIEFLRGDFPLIISVPHGGYKRPANIPERKGKVARNQDIYTIEITYEIIRNIQKLTGKHPHVIINHLHRTRLDANRNLDEAAKCNTKAGIIWHAYHEQIKKAKSIVSEEVGKGLLIDIHGHRHKTDRIELGYALSAEELQLDDELLDEGLLTEYASIRHLAENNNLELQFSELIRGDYSLGTLLWEKGQACVPSKITTFPEHGEPFFSGGFIVNMYGSSRGGRIDAIQIEIGLHTRSDDSLRQKVAADIARSLIEFMSLHYFPQMDEIAVYGESVLDRHSGK